MWDVMNTGLNVIGVGALCGIFLRLGSLTEAVRGLRGRVKALEGWRASFYPSIDVGGPL